MKTVHRRVVAALLAFGLLAIAGCTTPEAGFPTLTNDARRAAGLGPLSTDPPGGFYFYNQARAHAQAMCRAGRIYHSTSGTYSQAPAGLRRLGENVGVAGWNDADQNSWAASTNALFGSFMRSASHRANILGAWTHQVVAHHVCGAKIYVTHVFVLY